MKVKKICKKCVKSWKIWKKNRKKFDKFLKNFWNFSKSENQKILKLIFGRKNTFTVLLRPKYIHLHSFSTQNWIIKFSNFRHRIFIRNFKKNCGHFLWGLTPQKAHTGNTKCTLQSLLLPRVMKTSVLWKN